MTELLEKGGASQPDVIEAAFTAVCTLFKHLAQHLTADLPSTLRVTAPLRYSAAAGHHVRVFAAQAAGGLVKTGGGKTGEIGGDGGRGAKGTPVSFPLRPALRLRLSPLPCS